MGEGKASPMKNIVPERLAVIRATLSLLFHSNPRAFITSAIASLPEPLFFPAVVFLLQRLFERLTGPEGTVQVTSQVTLLGIALVATLLIQRLGIIVRDASSTILRQQAWVAISKRVMQKLPSVPYSLFEDNSFQAHYGLVIREASHRKAHGPASPQAGRDPVECNRLHLSEQPEGGAHRHLMRFLTGLDCHCRD